MSTGLIRVFAVLTLGADHLSAAYDALHNLMGEGESHLCALLDAAEWDAEINEFGGVEITSYRGEKWTDEEVLVLKTLTPWLKGYIELTGDDGEVSGYWFRRGEAYHRYVTWNDSLDRVDWAME